MVPLQTQLQESIFSLDGLYCEEEKFEEDLGGGFGSEEDECNETHVKPLTLLETDLLWEEDEIVCLLSKEKEICSVYNNNLDSNGSLMVARKEAIDWMLRVIEYYGFTPVTAVLAVNYFDRFISGLCFQRDKPWMSQLAAVACLSIAAKVEETQVPLLLDLQVEDCKYVFEAKTIQRMELLVLSTLQWKMNPVTPLSFIDHIIRRFGLMSNLHLGFLTRCERLLVSVIKDSRLLHYVPSVVATATMLFVIKEIEPCNAILYQSHILDIFKISKEKVDACYKLILELMGDHGNKQHQSHKRKHQSVPGSPSGVIDAYFSCDSSNDSWAVASPVSSSPEPLYKRSRVQEQRMRLASFNSVSVGVGSTPN